MKILKQISSLILCAAILFLFGCSNDPAPQIADTSATTTATIVPEETVDPNAPLCDGKTLKLLAITSSFGVNTTQLLYDVAVAEGCTDVVVGRLYIGGCTLETHVENAKTNAPAYQYTKNSSGLWEAMGIATLEYGLQDEDWDIIFLQQSAAEAGIESSYGDYVDQLLTYVQKTKSNPSARVVWNMTWAYQSDSKQPVFVDTFKSDQLAMYNSIVDIVKEKIAPRTDFARIIPTGTVLQNARTSAFGDTFCKDTYHLNNYGAIFAAYGLYATVTDQELTDIRLNVISTYANGVNNAEKITEPLTEEQKAIIMESVNNAIKNPFEVTESQYPPKK